jgi:hypothetical protein
MTKLVDFKKPAPWETIQEMAESFAERVGGEDNELSSSIISAVIMYRYKDGTVSFECNENASALDVGMMAAAVHMACIFEMTGMDEDETVH